MDTSLLWEIIEILYLNENEPMTVLDLKRELDPGRDRSITKRDINRVLYYKRGTVFQTCGNSPEHLEATLEFNIGNVSFYGCPLPRKKCF